MKLALSNGSATATIEGDPVEIRSLLPDVARILGLVDEEQTLFGFDGFEDPFPDDFHHTSTTSVDGYAALIGSRTGKRVETVWPICLNGDRMAGVIVTDADQ